MSDFQLPQLDDEYKFEKFIRDLFNEEYSSKSFQIYKGKGCGQNGIDIFSPTEKIAIQCKKKDILRTDNKLEKELLADLEESIQKLQNFPHEYKTFILATTTKKYSKVQEKCIEYSQLYHIEIQFWDWKTITEYVVKYDKLLKLYNYQKFLTKIDSKNFVEKMDWEGTYLYLHSTNFDPFFKCQLLIFKQENEYLGEFSVDGWQTMIRLSCSMKEDINSIFVFYKEDKINNMFPSLYEKNDLLLKINFNDSDGKFIVDWEGYSPYFFDSNDNNPTIFHKDKNDLQFLRKYEKKNLFTFDKLLESRLQNLCGDSYSLLLERIFTQPPIEIEDDFYFVLSGFYPHLNGREEAIIIIDFNRNKIHVGLLQNGTNISTFSESNEPTPKTFVNFINIWKKNSNSYKRESLLKRLLNFFKI